MSFNRKMMLVLFALLNLGTNRTSAQNLVLNPSFEDTLPCPTSVVYPFIKAQYWIQPTAGSSDFFSVDTSCIYSGGGGVPQNVFGWQNPHSGESYCGFSIYNAPPNQNSREYITGILSDSLITGNKYCISFWISAANNCKYQTDDIGVYFSSDTSSFTDYTMNNVLNLIPQVENTQGNILSDTLNWTQVTGDFIAQGGEKFITIGNFKNDANTTLTILSGAIYNFGYYYIDDVSVIDCTVGINELALSAKDVTLFPNPCIDEITVEIANGFSNILHYEITDVMGKTICTGVLKSSKEIINVSKLNSGVYCLNFSNVLNSVCKRFIKL